jgi:hypothetical protein
VEISPRQLIATIRIAVVGLVEMPAKNEVKHSRRPAVERRLV